MNLRLASSAGRWAVAAAVLASGAVFVESTVVSVALPAMARDLHFGLAGMQWVMNAYLLALGALMLTGGALGDVFGFRRMLMLGLAAFAAACVAAALAPDVRALLVIRVVQGGAGALLVPNTLAMVNAEFDAEDRGAAIGQWAAWSASSTALGPLVGGWVVQASSWRWIFVLPIPLALGALWILRDRVPAAPAAPGAAGPSWRARVDVGGALLATLALAAVTWALVAGPSLGERNAWILAAEGTGVLLAAGFVIHEWRARYPMLPLGLFRSLQFSGANLVTLFVYAALGALFFLLMIELQRVLHYGALAAGASLLPINVAMLLVSPSAGRLGRRVGPRWPIAAGAVVAATGMALLTRVSSGSSYTGSVLPGVLVFGLGLATLVAPLTSAVLAAADSHGGVASAVNNAVARLAGLVATAALPLAAGLGRLADAEGSAFTQGFERAMWISAALCLAGAAVAFVTVRQGAAVAPAVHPSPGHGCVDYRGAARPRHRDRSGAERFEPASFSATE